MPVMPEGESTEAGGEYKLTASDVYKLNKEELTAELRNRGLDTGGRVDDMRARLSQHLRSTEGRSPTPRRSESEPEPLRTTPWTAPPTTPTIPLVCDVVRKWGVKFDGESDPVSFLERIEELTTCYQLQPNALLQVLPELLKGKALLWFRNNRDSWKTWPEFENQFRIQYLPARFQWRLEEEIRKRTQGSRETITEYVTALQTLLRRHGGYPPASQLERIYENLRPEYKLYVRRRDFRNLPELIQQATEYETLKLEEATFRPPPLPVQAYMSETAYEGRKSRGEKAPHAMAAAAETPEASPRPMVTRPRVSFDTPHPVREAPSPVSRSSNFNSRSPSVPARSQMCWRCGEAGHWRTGCRNPPKLFCSWCGQQGVRSDHPGCKRPSSGNAQGRREK